MFNNVLRHCAMRALALQIEEVVLSEGFVPNLVPIRRHRAVP